MTSYESAGQVDTRILKSVLVSFGSGASVSSIKHPSDYSAIQVSYNRPQSTTESIAIFLFDHFREPVGLPRIHIITSPDACPVIAQVQVKDPSFAARIKGKFDGYVKHVPQTRVAIETVPVEISYEGFVNPPEKTPIRRQLLQDRHARLRIKEIPTEPECAVCLTEADEPYLTACGHWYCRACFGSQCSSVNKDNIPIRCLGNSGKCSQIFLLPELRLVLRSEAFEQLLEHSYTIYFKTIETIRECPTVRCRQSYRTSTDGSVITCFMCSAPVCTTCQAPSHSGMTCTMYQRFGTADIQTWKLNKDIRKCPKCRNLIEKTSGCDRVDCHCGACICWVCMELRDPHRLCRCRGTSWGLREIER